VQYAILYCLGLCKYTFAQRQYRLTTHFSERIPVVNRRISLLFKVTSPVPYAQFCGFHNTIWCLADNFVFSPLCSLGAPLLSARVLSPAIFAGRSHPSCAPTGSKQGTLDVVTAQVKRMDQTQKEVRGSRVYQRSGWIKITDAIYVSSIS